MTIAFFVVMAVGETAAAVKAFGLRRYAAGARCAIAAGFFAGAGAGLW